MRIWLFNILLVQASPSVFHMAWLNEGSLGPVLYASPLINRNWNSCRCELEPLEFNYSLISIHLNFYLFDLTITFVVGCEWLAKVIYGLASGWFDQTQGHMLHFSTPFNNFESVERYSKTFVRWQITVSTSLSNIILACSTASIRCFAFFNSYNGKYLKKIHA